MHSETEVTSLMRGGSLSLEVFGVIRLYSSRIYESGKIRSIKNKEARFFSKLTKLSLNRKLQDATNIERGL